MPCKLYTFTSSRQDDDARLSVRGRRVALCVVGDWAQIDEIVRTAQQSVRDQYGADLLIRSLGAADGWLNIGGMERDNPGLAYVIVSDVQSIMAELQMRGVGQPVARRSSPAPVTSSPPATIGDAIRSDDENVFADQFYWLQADEQDMLMEGATITLNGPDQTREVDPHGAQHVVRVSGPFMSINTLEVELQSAYWREAPPGSRDVLSARARRARGRNNQIAARAPIPGPLPGERSIPLPPVTPPQDILPRTVRRQFVEDPDPEPAPGPAPEPVDPQRPRHENGMPFVTVEVGPLVEWSPQVTGIDLLVEQILEIMAQMDGHIGGGATMQQYVGANGEVTGVVTYREVSAHREEALRMARVISVMRILNRGASQEDFL